MSRAPLSLFVEDGVVPFDRRSFIELFSASATPFAPLAFLLELPEKFRALVSLLGG